MKGFSPISARPLPHLQEPLSFHDEKDFNCSEGRGMCTPLSEAFLLVIDL